MTRLPHIGLGGEQRSLYGDNSTIGEQGRRERAELAAELLRRMLRSDPSEPIRVQASVGQPIPELTSDA